MAAKWDTVAIVGVGLIGGSIGLALRQRRLANRVIGIGRNPRRLEIAEQFGAIDEAVTDLAAGVARAELTIICTPVETIATFVRQVARSCPADGLITDAGSTKQMIVEELHGAESIEPATFVGSHPLAGSEKAGVQHADGQLLTGRTVVITPTPDDTQRRCPADRGVLDGSGGERGFHDARPARPRVGGNQSSAARDRFPDRGRNARTVPAACGNRLA